jgi:hypothetical protein
MLIVGNHASELCLVTKHKRKLRRFFSPTLNTENERKNTFIYDVLAGGKMGGAYFISLSWIMLI